MYPSIDIRFDVRTDANGKDPDSASPALKKFHRLLWSKRLPDGNRFDLTETADSPYLIHRSDLGVFHLSSDSVIHTYSKWKRMKHIIDELPPVQVNEFVDLAYTVGGFLVFPGNKINGLPTLNQERGTSRWINDRLDLTLECIRRYYCHETSPLEKILNRYGGFFSLFNDFSGYCDYFLLQDLTTNGGTAVNFFLPFDGFVYNPLPQNLEQYDLYRTNNLRFLSGRNSRIDAYSKQIDANTVDL